jgi:hypothetical protein
MKLNVDKQILERAIEKWGIEVQVNKIQEEALELALVMNQLNCPTKDPFEYEQKFYNELADNVIMMHYYPLLFDEERLQIIINKKLSKLEGLINH